MEPFKEFEGKNVDQAIKKACEELNSSKNSLKYDIISNGSSGIFGLVGVKKAKIRVIIPMSVKEENIENQIDTVAEKENDGIKSLVDEAFNTKEYKRDIKKTTDNLKTHDNKRNNDSISLEEKRVIEIPEEVVTVGKEALQKIVDLITTDAKVEVKQESDRLLFDVIGGNSGILIGKRGQNLEAIQYIIDKIVNKKSDQRVRLQIDVEGYLNTRKNNLRSLATRLAEKAKRTGKPSTIGQMNAHDRRIVHLELKSDRNVRTQSIGDGYYRKLVIFPKKANNRKKKYQKDRHNKIK